MSAALLASPLVPLASAQTGGTGGTTTEDTEPGDAERVLAGDAILRYGDTGSAVAAVQQKLAVDDDGIFGPITENAVEGFQSRTGIPVTGEVDSRTWTALFRAAVSFVPEGSPEAKAIQASVSGDDVAVAEPEARVATPSPPRPTSPASEPKHEHKPAADDDAEEPKAKKGGARPEAGVEKTSKVPDPKIEVSDEVAVAGDGSCATGEMGTPVEGPVTGAFGEDRGSHRHGGLDIAAPSGTAVRAALCGTVTQAGAQGAYGNLICIRHTAEFSTCYAHLSSFNTRAGQYVAVGQLIGRVGSTGRSTGPHLHFETRINGRAHDPEPYLSGERRVPGTSSGGGEASAASNGGEPRSAQRSSTSSSSSGQTSTASTQSTQPSGTGGESQPAPEQQPAAASQPAPRQASSQEPAAQQPAAQQPAAQESAAPAQEQPAPEQQAPAPAQQAPVEEPASAEVAMSQAVDVTPEAEVKVTEAPVVEEAAPAPVEELAEAPVAEAPVAPVEEALAPVVAEETPPAAAAVEETPAAVVATVAP